MTIVSEVPAEDGGPRRFPQGRFKAPAGACELLLVRHGQSEDAVEGQDFARFEGHADPPLSALGREQARRLAARLVTEHIDAVYVTSLRRTAETAAPLAAVTGHEPVVEHDLREIYPGRVGGLGLRTEVRRPRPAGPAARRGAALGPHPGLRADRRVRLPGPCRNRAHRRRPSRRARRWWWSTGASSARCWPRRPDLGPWAFIGADNASISHVVVTDGRWVVRRFNDTTHLDDRLTVQAAPLI